MTTTALPARVYRPQADSLLLIDAMRALPLPAGARVVDLCTGSGIVASRAALLGAREVVAIDDSPDAVATARRRAADLELTGVMQVRQVPVQDWSERGGFDVITANPPYVPVPDAGDPADDPSLHPPGPSHSWDAGPQGRDVLEVLCAAAPPMLRPGGTLLVVQSEIADIDATVDALVDEGLEAEIVAEQQIPFGPVMNAREHWLKDRGWLAPWASTERIAVIAGRKPGR